MSYATTQRRAHAGFGSYGGFGAFGTQPTIGVGRANPPAVVRLWQAFIGVPADGAFGSGTKAATMIWQTAHGLTGDGVVGPATWAKADEVQGGGDGAPPGGGGTTIVIPGIGPVALPPGVPIPPGATIPAAPPGLPSPSAPPPIPGAPPPADTSPPPATVPGAGPLDQVKTWWNGQPRTVQLATMGGGALALVALVVLLLPGGKKKSGGAKAVPNRWWKRRRRRRDPRAAREKTFPFRRVYGPEYARELAKYTPNRNRLAETGHISAADRALFGIRGPSWHSPTTVPKGVRLTLDQRKRVYRRLLKDGYSPTKASDLAGLRFVTNWKPRTGGGRRLVRRRRRKGRR